MPLGDRSKSAASLSDRALSSQDEASGLTPHGGSIDDQEDAPRLEKWGMCTPIKALRDHRAELMAVRDIIVDGHAWTVYKLLRDVDELECSCDLLQVVLRGTSGYRRIKAGEVNQAYLNADYIDRYIRPSILTLSIIKKLLGEVEHETAKKEKLEVTLI
eukprot:COSAG04_NODE_9489_length_859_cov_1.318421_1_plen_158_part_01